MPRVLPISILKPELRVAPAGSVLSLLLALPLMCVQLHIIRL
jgi:hypothetical protein